MKEYLISNYKSIRKRTVKIVQSIPNELMTYQPVADKFSLGDIARHIILLERDFYLPLLLSNTPCYKGCNEELIPSKNELLNVYNDQTNQMINYLVQTDDDSLSEAVNGPKGKIPKVKWITLMFEHEVHHRGQIYLMLSHQKVQIPDIFNMKSEDLIKEK